MAGGAGNEWLLMFADDALWTLRSRPPRPMYDMIQCACSAALSSERADVGLDPADYKPLYYVKSVFSFCT